YWNPAGGGRLQRWYCALCGNVRVFISLGNAFCTVCGISGMDEFLTQIWWLVEHCKSFFRIFRTRFGFQVFIECRSCTSTSLAGKRSIPRYLDCNFWNVGILSLRKNPIAARFAGITHFRGKIEPWAFG